MGNRDLSNPSSQKSVGNFSGRSIQSVTNKSISDDGSDFRISIGIADAWKILQETTDFLLLETGYELLGETGWGEAREISSEA